MIGSPKNKCDNLDTPLNELLDFVSNNQELYLGNQKISR